jgi:isopenicillin N synthase-like dioxygenase
MHEGQIPLVSLAAKDGECAVAIGRACREHGFFYIYDHGVSEDLQARLASLSEQFFAWEESRKMQLAMVHGGLAWRGYFPVGGELTSGQPDLKEGFYFGAELGPEHPLVQAKTPLHGGNLFPDIPGFKSVVLDYIQALTELGHRLMQILSLSLGLEARYFYERYTSDPLVLLRLFHYPVEPDPAAVARRPWGVGEHTDYGLLTILKQDQQGGLQVKSRGSWLEAPPLPGTFVCNIGDMLDRMTGGLYRSTPHRVRNVSGKSRYSVPFFFDPHVDAVVRAVDVSHAPRDDGDERWDKANVHSFEGTYGDYLMQKVGRVFPTLKASIKG